MSSIIGDAIKAALNALPPADKYDYGIHWETVGQVLDSYISQTLGMYTFAPTSTPPTGWLLCDGKTLGKTGSGADYTGDTYKSLYDHLKATFGGVYDWDGLDTINLPDGRGLFVRGAGISGILSDASGTPFEATAGDAENDKSQGHHHNALYYDGSSSSGSYMARVENRNIWNAIIPVTDPIDDGVNGTPRTGNETQPANICLGYLIIKY